MKKILVTDSLFIFQEHEEKLRAAGFEVMRLDKTNASEDELVEHLRGVSGYILGGIEKVTSRVIDASDLLEAIAFTGSGYSEFIPGYRRATERGIAISAAIGGNARAVAEYALALTLNIVRRVSELTNPQSGKSFLTVKGFSETTIGVVGYGNIGREYAALCQSLGFKVVIARSGPHDSHPDRLSLADVIQRADIISLHVSKHRGTGVMGRSELLSIREGTGIVNTAFSEALDIETIDELLNKGRIYLANDGKLELKLSSQTGHLIASNAQTAFNTSQANKAVSDRATSSILNLLQTASDKDLVNPEFRNFRERGMAHHS